MTFWRKRLAKPVDGDGIDDGHSDARLLMVRDGAAPSGGGGPQRLARGEDGGDILAQAWLEQHYAPASSVPTFAAGEVLAGRYVVERLCARGGMGEVYAAFDRRSGQRIAVKTVLSTYSDHPGAVLRLRREFRVARLVDHPNVCRVYDLAAHEDDPRDVVHFMTMEFVEGQSLRRFRGARALPVADALPIARQILLGLDAVHAAGVVHRDLKSDNVMICGSGAELRVVLIDFGLSRMLDRCHSVAGSPITGSPGYMAPEQMYGSQLSARTDVFAFGVVLFEMLTGRLPNGSIEGAPPALERLVQRCLRPAPSERYRNARSVLSALERAGAVPL